LSAPLLSVRGLNVSFRQRDHSVLHVVRDLNFDVERGSALAIVGESGSGKSVTMRSIVRLLPETAEISGQALFDGVDLLSLPPKQLRRYRGRRVGFIFQNAMVALNPTMPLERQMTEHLIWHDVCDRTEARQRAINALGDVGIPAPERRIRMYPFQLSGGMRQRAMIAMVMAARPEFIVADEPTTAVDVTVQRQILDLLKRLKDDGLSIVMITHDLGVARYFCDETLVLYAGETMERASTQRLLDSPAHPYTNGLLTSAVDIGDVGELHPIPGSPPDLAHRPVGCSFHPRCSSFAGEKCHLPQGLVEVGENRQARCWLAGATDA
jgi:oligopeptide/dipeptide ABC transporter ATP-binding protein